MYRIEMTALSPTMDSGIIIEWTVHKGDLVRAGDVLCEVETDVADIELISDVSGVLLEIVKPKGSKCLVGDVIGTVDDRR